MGTCQLPPVEAKSLQHLGVYPCAEQYGLRKATSTTMCFAGIRLIRTPAIGPTLRDFSAHLKPWILLGVLTIMRSDTGKRRQCAH
jgi:hypothetical protein